MNQTRENRMAGKSARIPPSDRGIEQAIVALKKGAHLLKCGKSGKPKFCPFRLSMDEKVLIWYSGEKEKYLKLNSVSNIISGQKTVNFLRQRQPEKDSQSFSLIYQNGERSLDLICKDKQEAESWLLGLTALVSVSYHPRPLAKLKNSRGAHSCVNSPIGHIQRKHKLGLLQDSAKSSQVRSLHGSPPRSLIKQYFYDSMLDSSSVLYSSRQRTLSDIQPLWDKMIPHLPHMVSNSSKDIGDSNPTKEYNIILTSTISLNDHENPASDGTGALKDVDGTGALKDVFMWGEGIGGILGGGLNKYNTSDPKVDALLPKLLESTRMLDVQNISCGAQHAALVTEQGEVFCWGEENGGRLGHKIIMDVPYPKVVESLSRICVKTIACGSLHTCAVTSSGELYSWGHSSHGVGLAADGCDRSQWFPRRICCSLDGICISKVACGEWHTAAVSSSGQLFTYGDGTFGVLGHGNLKSFSQPKEVESLRGLKVKSVACGPWHTAAVVEIIIGNFKSNAPCGKLFTWGDGDKGRLGHADQERKLLPTCVASLVDCEFVQVSCGRVLTVALTITGIVFTMGSSLNGQLGNPHAEDKSITDVEGFLKGEVVKEISSGSSHVAVLTTKGNVYTWGKGSNGRLGLGDTNDRNTPALVEALEDRLVQSVACGSSFTAAICLHKSMSSKDHSVCSACGIEFGFTRKKHNCYNCGSAFCHSCSSNKSMNASLAPNNNKRFRVCDPCFAHMRKLVDPRLDDEVSTPRQPLMSWRGPADQKINSEDSYSRTKKFPPKGSTQDMNKLVEGSTLTMHGSNQRNQESVSPFLGTTQRWGQVSCPQQFNVCARENSLVSYPWSTEFSDVLAQKGPSLSRATSSKEDLTKIDKMLKEELHRLNTEAMILSQQCLSNSQKLQQYKCRIDEMWSVSREEAEKCKAAKDVIEVLTNKMNAVSEKFSTGKEMNRVRSVLVDKVNICRPHHIERDLSEPSSAKPLCSTSQLSNDAHMQEDWQTDVVSSQRMQCTDAIIGEDKLQTRSDELGIAKEPKEEWVEQDERGVYITFITLPSGRKGLKRVRFSRKHFSSNQAERWWEENQSRIYVKYNIERFVTARDRRELIFNSDYGL